MKKILIITAILLSLIILPKIVLAQNNVDVWVFGTATCPYCKALRAHMSELVDKNPQINYQYFELTGIVNQDNRDNLDKLKKIYKATDYTGVPITFIGDRIIRGNAQDDVDAAIDYCLEAECESPEEKLANAGDLSDSDDEPVGQTEQMIGWVILAIFILVVAIFGFKIIKDRR